MTLEAQKSPGETGAELEDDFPVMAALAPGEALSLALDAADELHTVAAALLAKQVGLVELLFQWMKRAGHLDPDLEIRTLRYLETISREEPTGP